MSDISNSSSLLAEESENIKGNAFDSLKEDQLLRCYIFEHYASAEYEGHVVITNMQAIFDWIMNGAAVRSASPPPKGSKPKAVNAPIPSA